MGVLLQRIFLFYFHTRFWSTCSRRHMLTLRSPTSKNSGHIYGQFDILGLWLLVLPFHLYPSGCMVTKHTMELTLLTSTNSHVYSWICHFGVLKTHDCPDFWCFALILRKWLGTRACIQFYKPLLKASTWHISGSMKTVNTQLIVVSFCQNFVGTRYGTNTCGDIWIGGGSGNVVSGVVAVTGQVVYRNEPLYYDIGDAAPWKNTIVDTVNFISNGVDQNLLCPFAACMKFNVDIIKNCSMHCLNLGLAFTANGACLKLLLDLGYFGDPNVELKFRLNNAFDDFQTFCKLSKISCSQRRFRVKHLMKESHGPYLTTKAFNARCIVAWLASCFLDAFNGIFSQNRLFGVWLQLNGQVPPVDDIFASHAIAINHLARYFSLTERNGRCLTLWLT